MRAHVWMRTAFLLFAQSSAYFFFSKISRRADKVPLKKNPDVGAKTLTLMICSRIKHLSAAQHCQTANTESSIESEGSMGEGLGRTRL